MVGCAGFVVLCCASRSLREVNGLFCLVGSLVRVRMRVQMEVVRGREVRRGVCACNVLQLFV